MKILLSLLLCLFCFQASAEQAEPITKLTVAVGSFPPFVTCNNNKAAGINVDFVSKVFAAVNVRLEYTCMPWRRVYKSVKRNKFDLSFPYIKNPEREKDLFFFSEPIIITKQVMFHRKTLDLSERPKSMLNLYRIGGLLGHAYGPHIAEYDKEVGLDRSETLEIGLEKLGKKRIDILIEELNTGKAGIARLPESMRDLFTYSDLPDSDKGIKNYLVTGHDNPRREQIAQLFSAGFKAVNKDKPAP